jgi:hypothetical protein
MNKVIILSFLIFIISSCSFQSRQFNLLRDLIIEKDIPQGPMKNWKLTWGNDIYDLYAINITDQIIFADRNVNIFYKNQQIYKVTGLPLDEVVMEAEIIDSGLIYKLNGNEIIFNLCQESTFSIDENEYQKISQICFEKNSNNSYENYIVTNDENMIVSLMFRVHPNYPPLKLNRK